MFKLINLGKSHVLEAINFTAKTFVKAEPASLALNLTPCDFHVSFRKIMSKCVLSGNSWAYVDKSGEICAQSLSMPYDEYLKIECERIQCMEPMIDILGKLNTFEPKNKDKCMYIFAVSSDKKCEGMSFATKLIEKTIEDAKFMGFESVLADCTNVISQHICINKLQFEKRYTVSYKDYAYGKMKPFKDVEGTEYVLRVMKYI